MWIRKIDFSGILRKEISISLLKPFQFEVCCLDHRSIAILTTPVALFSRIAGVIPLVALGGLAVGYFGRAPLYYTGLFGAFAGSVYAAVWNYTRP